MKLVREDEGENPRSVAAAARSRSGTLCFERRASALPSQQTPAACLPHFLNLRHINTGQRAALSRARPLSIA